MLLAEHGCAMLPCREAEARAARDLENSQSEWYRLKELEEEYSRNYSAAQDRFNGLRSSHEPVSKYEPYLCSRLLHSAGQLLC